MFLMLIYLLDALVVGWACDHMSHGILLKTKTLITGNLMNYL